jgi:hypothetical protein
MCWGLLVQRLRSRSWSVIAGALRVLGVWLLMLALLLLLLLLPPPGLVVTWVMLSRWSCSTARMHLRGMMSCGSMCCRCVGVLGRGECAGCRGLHSCKSVYIAHA